MWIYIKSQWSIKILILSELQITNMVEAGL